MDRRCCCEPIPDTGCNTCLDCTDLDCLIVEISGGNLENSIYLDLIRCRDPNSTEYVTRCGNGAGHFPTTAEGTDAYKAQTCYWIGRYRCILFYAYVTNTDLTTPLGTGYTCKIRFVVAWKASDIALGTWTDLLDGTLNPNHEHKLWVYEFSPGEDGVFTCQDFIDGITGALVTVPISEAVSGETTTAYLGELEGSTVKLFNGSSVTGSGTASYPCDDTSWDNPSYAIATLPSLTANPCTECPGLAGDYCLQYDSDEERYIGVIQKDATNEQCCNHYIHIKSTCTGDATEASPAKVTHSAYICPNYDATGAALRWSGSEDYWLAISRTKYSIPYASTDDDECCTTDDPFEYELLPVDTCTVDEYDPHYWCEGIIPSEITVTASGLSGNCSFANGSHVLPLISYPGNPVGASDIVWRYENTEYPYESITVTMHSVDSVCSEPYATIAINSGFTFPECTCDATRNYQTPSPYRCTGKSCTDILAGTYSQSCTGTSVTVEVSL